eukprot:4107710-Heterocapsa_arctica.AAC.1
MLPSQGPLREPTAPQGQAVGLWRRATPAGSVSPSGLQARDAGCGREAAPRHWLRVRGCCGGGPLV